MDQKEIIKKIKPELEKVLGFWERELLKIQTGRASVSLVEDIMVDCFGQKLPLKQLGSISCPSPREIVIQPWDKSYLEEIERAISRSSLGLNPVVSQDVVRLSLPLLSEEYRKDLIRTLSDKQEEVKRTIRRWREEAWREIQQKEREGEIREDDKYRAKDELQEMIDEYNGKIEELAERKKKEMEL